MVLSAGKQLSDHLRQAPEVVGDGEEHPMYPVGHQVLEDLNSERPLLPALEHPEPEDVLGSPQVNAHCHKQHHIVDLAVLSAELSPVPLDEDGEPV